MTDSVAAIRASSNDLPLLLHVGGAMVLVGALVLVVLAVAGARGARDDRDDMLRLGFRALVLGAIPAWISMRVGAQWIYSEQGLDELETDPAWIGIGFITSEPPLLLMIGAAVALRLALKGSEHSTAARVATVLVGISLLACVVAIWAMTAKPA